MGGSPYGAYRARLLSRTVEHYLRPTFRVRDSADDSGEHLRFDAFLDQLPNRAARFEPKPRTWLVTGGAGSGKSTAVLQCAVALLERETPCVVVDNRTIRQQDVRGMSVKDLARELRPADIDEPLWKQHVKKNRVVFLVDALNELEREFDDTPEWKFIRRLVAGSHEFTVVATSRGRFDELEWTVQRDVGTLSIEPLGEQDIETYLGMRDGSAGGTLTEIRTSGMLGVASNPFMLTLLTDWLLGTRSVKDRRIPRSRADLLRETVVRPGSEGRLGETRAEREAARRGLGMEAALCAAALAALSTGRGNADFLAVDVEALLRRVWDDEKVIGHVVKAFLETQMVEPVGDPANRQYSLLHPAFVDFGLALGWQNSVPPSVVLDPGHLDQCLGDWVGLQPDPDEAVRGLLAEDAEPLPPELITDVLLANRGVLGDDVREALWRRLGECFTRGRQTRDRLAGAMLGVPGSLLRDGVRRGLMRALTETDPALADAVQQALWNGLLDAPTLQWLRRKHLQQQREKAGPRDAGLDEEAIAQRVTWLRTASDPADRRRSANWLGQRGGELGLGALEAAMGSDEDPAVRGASATALGRLRDPRAVPALTEVLTEETENDNVRGAAATALGHIRDPQAVPALSTVLAGKTENNVRGAAATALGQLRDPQAIPALSTALAEDPDSQVRGSAATALGHIRDPQAVPALTRALGDDGEKVRASAATALGHLRDPRAVPALSTALTDRGSQVRGSAATALGHIRDPRALSALIRVLGEDRDDKVRGSAATALGHLRDPQAVPALGTALTEDRDPYTRGSAATALGHIGHPAALPALLRTAAEDPDDKVRGSAATALGRIGDPVAADVLRDTVRDHDETYRTRRAAASALTHLDTGDESWAMEVADRLRYTVGRDLDGRALRGALVNLTGRRELTPETKKWLVKVVHDDPDQRNRTVALEGLARAGQADPDLIRFTVAPDSPRGDGRPRDTDAGVLGVAAASVVRAATEEPAYTESLLPGVVHLLKQKDTLRATVIAPFAQLRQLPLAVADRLFSRVVELVGEGEPENPYLATALRTGRESLDWRKRVQADVESFGREPEAVLAGFREQRKSRFEVTATPTTTTGPTTATGAVGGGGDRAAGGACHVALLTAVPVEARALFSVLNERGITRTRMQRDGRYYHSFELPSPDREPVRVITTLATDQGGQSAAAVTHDVLSLFRPHLVLLIGVCGGFAERGVAQGDVLLAREVFHYDPERVQPGGGGGRPQVYRSDEQVQRLFLERDVSGDLEEARGDGTLRVVDFASGEKVIAWREAELRARLLGLSADIGGVETEAHGVLHVVWEAFKAKSLVGAAMLKCVSDLGDEDMAVDKQARQTAAAQRAARVALDLIAAFSREDA